MFYKKINGKWYKAKTVNLPSGEVLTAQNKENNEGWEWYDEPPKEYINSFHLEGFEKAVQERQTPTVVNDINTLAIAPEVVENRQNKTFSVAYFLDNNYYYAENLNYEGILTQNEIEEEVINYLNKV